MDIVNSPNLLIDRVFNTKQATIYQKEWSQLLQIEDNFSTINTVAGLDIGYDYTLNKAFAVVVVLDAVSLAILEIQRATAEIEIPYQPGFLSFREVPVLAKAVNQLNKKPDLIICDGQGIAHPRRFGLACHLGLVFDIPTIGCGKSKLYGYAEQPGEFRGDFSYLYDNKKSVIGAVLRTRAHVSPVYISVGHRVSLPTAMKWIMHLAPKYRLPETTRLADKLAHEYKIASL